MHCYNKISICKAMIFYFPVELKLQIVRCDYKIPGSGCSKLMKSLVNISLKFERLIFEICQYFFLKKCEKLMQSFSYCFQQKNQCLVI